jgi:uncharacterized coiled-coil protein SlyX
MPKIDRPESSQPKPKAGQPPKAPVQAEKAPRKDGGETVRISPEARDPNRTGLMIKLLAGTLQAKDAAEAAKTEVARRDTLDKARAQAGKAFADATRSARGLLSVAEAKATGLADRKAKTAEAADHLEAAAKRVTDLDPSAQAASADVLERLQGRVDELKGQIAVQEKAVADAKDKLTADRKALDEALGKAKDEKALGRALCGLTEAYGDLDARVKDLPPDAAKEVRTESEALRKVIHRAMVAHADKSAISEPDNAYLFGRPGKAFKEHLRPVEDWLAGPAAPVSSDRRKAIVEHLQELYEALEDVQDPLLKQAASEVIADISAKAFARLSGAQ